MTKSSSTGISESLEQLGLGNDFVLKVKFKTWRKAFFAVDIQASQIFPNKYVVGFVNTLYYMSARDGPNISNNSRPNILLPAPSVLRVWQRDASRPPLTVCGPNVVVVR